MSDATAPDHAAPSHVPRIPPAHSTEAAEHFEALLRFETDCWDVHASMADGDPDFVLLQVTGGQEGFDAGHIAGATYFHHATMNEATLAPYPDDTVFVVYCAGPHCNGADRAAAKLARLGRPVKKMLGGWVGWQDEGFTLVPS